jgi:hypothetical protein
MISPIFIATGTLSCIYGLICLISAIATTAIATDLLVYCWFWFMFVVNLTCCIITCLVAFSKVFGDSGTIVSSYTGFIWSIFLTAFGILGIVYCALNFSGGFIFIMLIICCAFALMFIMTICFMHALGCCSCKCNTCYNAPKCC